MDQDRQTVSVHWQPAEGPQGLAIFALITRVQRSETPFLNKFFAYYRNLGVNCFYLVNTEPANRQAIEATVASEYHELVELIDKNSEDSLNECQNCGLPAVKEVFLVHVDMDEFLYLDGVLTAELCILAALANMQQIVQPQ